MLTFEEKDHVYRWNGAIVPSVSQVMSSVGKKKGDYWSPIGADARFIKGDTASKFGTAFHEYCRFTLQGIEVSYDPQIEPWIKCFHKFLEDHKDLDFLFIEKEMYSKLYRFAGTPDLGAQKGNVFHIIDWKTSTVMHTHYRIQTAAYEQLFRENFKIPKKVVRTTVRFDPLRKDKYELDVRERKMQDWTAFKSCLNLLRY